MAVIEGGCPLMFGPTADGGHKVMCAMLKMTGKLPRLALGVPGHQVGSSRLIGWLSSECAVASFSVVVLEPGCKGGGAFVVAGEDLPVGPLGGQGAVEALDLAVLPGAVGLDELLRGAELRRRLRRSE